MITDGNCKGFPSDRYLQKEWRENEAVPVSIADLGAPDSYSNTQSMPSKHPSHLQPDLHKVVDIAAWQVDTCINPVG